jgi:2'-hydroxyisoflavone reductase
MAEDDPVGTLEDESVETIDGSTYGPLKALCEQSIRDRLPGRALVIRPGLIVGPHDPTDRFTYWVWRIAQGGEVMAPPGLDYPVQIIDVRDLTAWTLEMIAAGRTGTYNATGPEQPLRIGEIFERSRAVSGSDAEWICPPAEFLREHEVQSFSDLPLWVDDPGYAGFFRVDISNARAAGLIFRPLDETIADTLAWANARPADHPWRAGLTPGRELELLKAFREIGV